jgi:hypothetical protein
MQMKKFILKTALVLIISGVCYFLAIFLVPPFRNNLSILSSRYRPDFNNCDILLAGDSRAGNQLDPQIINKRTKLNILNIAIPNLDLYTVSKAFQEINLTNKIVILSASSWQMNDGGIEDNFSIECYNDLSPKERWTLYNGYPSNYIAMQSNLFLRGLNHRYLRENVGDDNRLVNIGYTIPGPCVKVVADEKWIGRHPWYKALNDKGIRRELLKTALIGLSKLKNCKIIIYNGCVSQAFTDTNEKNGVMRYENEYDRFMSDECGKLHIKYVSFLNDVSLKDNSYYTDPQHLCETGVPIFTNKVVDLLYDAKFINRNIK